MSGTYQLWLTDDAGRKITLLAKYSYFACTRTVAGYGVIEFGMPYDIWEMLVPSIFSVDWRIDVWRSPGKGYVPRRESSYLLRKFIIYERITDGVRMIVLYGRSPLDLLRRQAVSTRYIIEDGYADDVMKAIVRQQFTDDPGTFSTPPYETINGVDTFTGEFIVDADVSAGPLVSRDVEGKNVLDELVDIKKATIALNESDATQNKIYFDVVENDGVPVNGFGYIFRTYAGLRGIDRTSGTVFSTLNGNLKQPSYYEDYLDEFTGAFIATPGGIEISRAYSNSARISRWNFSLSYQLNSTSYEINAADTDLYKLLSDGKASKVMNGVFLDSPGSDRQPRSLYGIDWDLGDLLPVEFAGRNFSCEVQVVYMAVDENGNENISGRSEVGSG